MMISLSSPSAACTVLVMASMMMIAACSFASASVVDVRTPNATATTGAVYSLQLNAVNMNSDTPYVFAVYHYSFSVPPTDASVAFSMVSQSKFSLSLASSSMGMSIWLFGSSWIIQGKTQYISILVQICIWIFIECLAYYMLWPCVGFQGLPGTRGGRLPWDMYQFTVSVYGNGKYNVKLESINSNNTQSYRNCQDNNITTPICGQAVLQKCQLPGGRQVQFEMSVC